MHRINHLRLAGRVNDKTGVHSSMLSINPRINWDGLSGTVSDPTPEEQPEDGEDGEDGGDITPPEVSPPPSPKTNNPPNNGGGNAQAQFDRLFAHFAGDDGDDDDDDDDTDKTPSPSPPVPASPARNQATFSATVW